jgi:hypothetical protein
VVTFKVLPLGSYALVRAPSPPSKPFWNWFCGMTFRAAIILILMSFFQYQNIRPDFNHFVSFFTFEVVVVFDYPNGFLWIQGQ